eukprot:scaffold28052_cov68-Cyclotella_meneghiniana.AAC.4
MGSAPLLPEFIPSTQSGVNAGCWFLSYLSNLIVVLEPLGTPNYPPNLSGARHGITKYLPGNT